ncbi:MAG TPA: hypothetical protein VGK43_04475 [Solirubrobacterales bacterium]
MEEILSSIRRKLEALLDGDSSAGLDRTQMDCLEHKVKATIAAEVIPHEILKPGYPVAKM